MATVPPVETQLEPLDLKPLGHEPFFGTSLPELWASAIGAVPNVNAIAVSAVVIFFMGMILCDVLKLPVEDSDRRVADPVAALARRRMPPGRLAAGAAAERERHSDLAGVFVVVLTEEIRARIGVKRRHDESKH